MKRAIVITLILGALSMTGILISHLAFTDIAHGEPDLTLEWKALQISFLTMIIFHLAAFYTLGKLLKSIKS